jgi:hypothetical protein
MIQEKAEIRIRKFVETDLKLVMDIEQLLRDDGQKQIGHFPLSLIGRSIILT